MLDALIRKMNCEDQIKEGGEVTQVIKVNNPQELKELLHEGTAAAISNMDLSTGEEAMDDEQKLLKHLSEYVMHGKELNDYENKVLKRLFPMDVTAIAAADKTLAPGEVWNLGTSAAPVSVTIGTLTMGAGSSIVAYNTAVTMTIDKLVKEAGSGQSNNFDIGIFGVDGGKGTVGKDGDGGGTGDTGKLGTCSSPGIQGDDGGPGGPGKTGSPGDKGGKGEKGKASMPAEINIKDLKGLLDNKLVIYTKSGGGGTGGDGGKGGKGGKGGTGGDGATCGCEGTSGGSGGSGGTGGKGGVGGDGGDAVPGNNITVYVPVGCTDKIVPVSEEAAGGQGGKGGAKGDGGDAGDGGSGGKHHDGGGKGGTGSPGEYGDIGKSSTVTGVPGRILVIEKY